MQMNDNHPVSVMIANARPRISDHGRLLLGVIPLECAVLADGRHGFILRQTMQAIGFEGDGDYPRLEAFCEKIGYSSLIVNDNQLSPFVECDNPFGPRATWLPWEMLHKVIVYGARAYREGELTAHQAHIGERCQELADALVGAGIAALIDEAIRRISCPKSPMARPQ